MPVLTDLDDPIRNPDRLRAIARFDLSDATLGTQLSELARVTAESLGRPMGLITIVLDSAQLFAGRHGLDHWLGETPGTPIEWSFCANVVRRGCEYVVPDALVDAEQRDNPLVAIDGIRSYAGVPISSDDGHVIGAACVLDRQPFTPSPDAVEQLRWSAVTALALLEERRHPLG